MTYNQYLNKNHILTGENILCKEKVFSKNGFIPYKRMHYNGRRKRIENILIEDDLVSKFNLIISSLNPFHKYINTDQISTISRWIKQSDNNERQALDFIKSRMSWYGPIKWVYENPNWGATQSQKKVASTVVDYFQNDKVIIPNNYPKIGMLDKSIFLNELETVLESVMFDYSDFKSFCETYDLKMEQTSSKDWLNSRVCTDKISREKSHKYNESTNIVDYIMRVK